MDLKEVIMQITKDMKNPFFVADNGSIGGFDLDWVLSEADGQAIEIFDCPADYWPECDDDYPDPTWFVAEVR